MKKRFISLFMALMLMVSLLPGAVFADGAVSIEVSDVSAMPGETMAVDISIAGASDAALMAAYLQFTFPSELELKSAELSDSAKNAGFVFGTNNLELGIIQIDGAVTGSSIEDDVFLTLTFAVDASAAGEYSIEVNYLDDDADSVYNVDYDNVACNFTAGTITVSTTVEPTLSEGVSLVGAVTNDNPVRVGTNNPIKVNVGIGQDYAATEMTITYDSALVSFDADNSAVGTAIVIDDNGTLTLADYGADKTASASNYVLAFTVGTTAGNAEFKVTEAGLGTGDSAVKDDLVPVDNENLGSVVIEIMKAQVTVTMPTDGLFYAENTTIEAGSDFTFYPEQTTGRYYDYTLPTATYSDGTAAVVTEIKDDAGNVTGWTIEDLEEDVTIAPAQRTPKNFGAITYGGDVPGVITNRTENAVYLSDITFTVPADVQPGTESGLYYWVTIIIDGVAYSATPVEDAAGNRTYTIPGTKVTGPVTVKVDATIIEPNKFTLTLGGNASADGQYEGSAGPGAPIQVDANGNAVLNVDTTSGLNRGYIYVVTDANGNTMTPGTDGKYTISGVTANAKVDINKTINVDEVKNDVETDSGKKNFVSLNGTEMWLIQLPNHVQNTTNAVYKYDGQQMFWSADHNNYVIVVISQTAPSLDASLFGLENVTATPTVASNYWDVNKSGTVDANDAQLIWNMYNNVYQVIILYTQDLDIVVQLGLIGNKLLILMEL